MKIKKTDTKGLSLIGVLVLILVIGVILVLIINGFATTVVVVEEKTSQEEVINMGKAYLSQIENKAGSKSFYEDLKDFEIPPVPLISEYTGSGKYLVTVETEHEDESSTKVTLTYRIAGSLSTEKPLLVMSLIVNDPEPDMEE